MLSNSYPIATKSLMFNVVCFNVIFRVCVGKYPKSEFERLIKRLNNLIKKYYHYLNNMTHLVHLNQESEVFCVLACH